MLFAGVPPRGNFSPGSFKDKNTPCAGQELTPGGYIPKERSPLPERGKNTVLPESHKAYQPGLSFNLTILVSQRLSPSVTHRYHLRQRTWHRKDAPLGEFFLRWHSPVVSRGLPGERAMLKPSPTKPPARHIALQTHAETNLNVEGKTELFLVRQRPRPPRYASQHGLSPAFIVQKKTFS